MDLLWLSWDSTHQRENVFLHIFFHWLEYNESCFLFMTMPIVIALRTNLGVRVCSGSFMFGIAVYLLRAYVMMPRSNLFLSAALPTIPICLKLLSLLLSPVHFFTCRQEITGVLTTSDYFPSFRGASPAIKRYILLTINIFSLIGSVTSTSGGFCICNNAERCWKFLVLRWHQQNQMLLVWKSSDG